MTAQGQGEIVRQAREAARMTRLHLAGAAGVSLSTLKRIEQDQTVTHENLRAVCAVLGLDVTSLPRPVPAAPGIDPLAGEYVDLDDAGRATLAGLGPVLVAGRCRAEAWLRQDGRAEARQARERRSGRLHAGMAACALTFVACLACLSLYLGWHGLLRQDASPTLTLAGLVVALVALAGFGGCAAPLTFDERAERRLAAEMGAALARVGVVTRQAYVGCVEAEEATALTVIPWDAATVRVTVEDGTAILAVEGKGGRHVVEGLPEDAPLVTESLRLAARGARVPSEPRPQAHPRFPNPWDPRAIDYVTRLAPGHARTRLDDTVTVRGPGREVAVTLSLRADRVGVATAQALTLLTGSRAYRIEPGPRAWIPLRLGQAFSLVQGEAGDARRLARGWVDGAPGFVLSARHVPDARAAPVELALRRLGPGLLSPAALLALLVLMIPVLVGFDFTLAERETRALQARGMSFEAAHHASSPLLRLVGAPAGKEIAR